MQSQLDKIINLVRRTGDRLIVLDRNDSAKSYVVMDIDAYEKLLDGNFKDNNKEECQDEEDDEEDYDDYEENDFLSDEDELNHLLKEDEFSFREPPLTGSADEYQPAEQDDFVPIGDIFNSAEEGRVSADEVDNNWGYGTIEQNIKNHQADGGRRRGRWEIAPEIKGKTPADVNAEAEEDRYYLETI